MNRLGQGVADAGHPGQLLAAGLPDALQAAEEAQQLPAALGAHAGDALQGGGAPNLVAASTVAGDGEAVSLVADMLDQVQRRGGAVQVQGALHRLQEERLEARLAGGALRSEERRVGKECSFRWG